MEILYLLIPLSLVLLAVIVWALLWAVHGGQFDDLEGPAHRIIFDDDSPPQERRGAHDGGETMDDGQPDD